MREVKELKSIKIFRKTRRVFFNVINNVKMDTKIKLIFL